MIKGRVESFTDGVIAIILTIMVLEFQVPKDPSWHSMLDNIPYLIAYMISYLFIGVAWYNHHYMFSLAKRITKRVFWANNLWLFTMSLLPIATAWTGRFIDQRAPEYFYLAIFLCWSLAYLLLSKLIEHDLIHEGYPELAHKITQMAPYRLISHWGYKVIVLLIIIAIYFVPPAALLCSMLQLVYAAVVTTDDSDRIEDNQ